MISLIGKYTIPCSHLETAFPSVAPLPGRVLPEDGISLMVISTDSQLLATVITREHCILEESRQSQKKGGRKNKEKVMNR